MKRILQVLLFFAIPGVSWGAGNQLYFSAESFSQSDPVSIHSFINDWRGRLKPGSNALSHNWVEAGGCYGNFCASVVQRLDYEIKASPDTARLYYQVRNHLALKPGTSYALNLRVYGQRSQGLRMAYRWHASEQFDMETGLLVLDGITLTQGNLTGSASVIAPKDYDYMATVDYVYSKDVLFGRHVSTPSGRGLTLDWQAKWQVTPQLYTRILVRDFFGFISWRNAPYTQAIADSHVKTFDSDGYASYNPTIAGFEGKKNFYQRLHPRALVGVDWLWDEQNTYGIKYRITEVRRYTSLRAEHRYGNCMSINGELDLTSHALGIGTACGPLSLSIMTDRPRLKYAQVLGFNMNLSYPLP